MLKFRMHFILNGNCILKSSKISWSIRYVYFGTWQVEVMVYVRRKYCIDVNDNNTILTFSLLIEKSIYYSSFRPRDVIASSIFFLLILY